MTQEFHISVTPIRGNDYLVRTERFAPGVPLAEEQVTWPVEDWLAQASVLMNDPLQGLLRGDNLQTLQTVMMPRSEAAPASDQSSASLIAFGQTLHNALFQGMVRDSWMMAQAIAQHQRQRLRLRLGLKDDRLPRLPWEVLHAGNRPVATGTDVIFSRYHSSFTVLSPALQVQQTPAIAADQPLRILMVLAAPNDQDVLALKQEAQNLKEELQVRLNASGRTEQLPDIDLTILDQPNREELTQTLEHNHFHVFHYGGHSNLGSAGGNLYLVCRKTGLTEILNGDDLAGLLVNNGIRMAVFNSCRGVYTATDDGSTEGNLAEALVKRGIPAVLAMAERIPDMVALNLSRLFYRNLKQAYPIDLSLSRARQGLISSYGSNQLYWALPILYLHPQFDGYLRLPAKPETDELRLGEVSLDKPVPAKVPEPALAGVRSGVNGVTREFPQLSEYADLDFDDADPAFDPDALEYEDPEFEVETTIAELVNQLSKPTTALAEERPLYADPTETLLPEPVSSRSFSYQTAYSEATDVAPVPVSTIANQPSSPAAAPSTAAGLNADLYTELEQMLAEAGKLTESLAAAFRAVRVQPNDAEMHHQLGWTLHQEGYIAEAIAAYTQALERHPDLAVAHNHLGLAQFHQGLYEQAIQSVLRAIELNPNLTEAFQNLDAIRLRLGQITGQSTGLTQFLNKHLPNVQALDAAAIQAALSAPGTLNPADAARRSSPQPVKRPWFWVGMGAIGAALCLGGWLAYRQFKPAAIPTFPTPAASVNVSADLSQLETGDVARIATEQLNQGNIAAAEKAVEALLDRGALEAVQQILTPALSQYPDNPTLNFLMGQHAWQRFKTGDRLYKPDDARRYWTIAAKQANPLYQNALGFAYYEEGKPTDANETWSRTLELSEQRSPGNTKPANSALPEPRLTAYAGIALSLMTLADKQPDSKRASYLTEALRLRQQVLSSDAAHFQPDALAKNWLWSEKAIQDWRSLLAIKAVE